MYTRIQSIAIFLPIRTLHSPIHPQANATHGATTTHTCSLFCFLSFFLSFDVVYRSLPLSITTLPCYTLRTIRLSLASRSSRGTRAQCKHTQTHTHTQIHTCPNAGKHADTLALSLVVTSSSPVRHSRAHPFTNTLSRTRRLLSYSQGMPGCRMFGVFCCSCC